MPDFALKIISDSGSSFVIGGYGVHFGDADLAGDRFTKSTDFWLDRITQNPPVLYQHGQDAKLKRTTVGRVTSTRVDDAGMWIEAQISAAKEYGEMIRTLVAKGVLGWSSGSVPHLVQRVKSDTRGVTEITSWPIVEFSLTPTPAEPRTVGVKELKMLATSDPLLETIARDAELAAAKEAKVAMADLPDIAFAHIASGGTLDDEAKTFPRAKRQYPHHDESGAVDHEMLHQSLASARKAHASSEAIAHLKLHALAASVHDDPPEHDEAHTKKWSGKAPSELLALSMELADLANEVATQHNAMELLGTDTKGGARIRPELCQLLEEAETRLHRVIDWAKTVDRGADGRARVNRLRTELQLMEV